LKDRLTEIQLILNTILRLKAQVIKCQRVINY
jgi:hypothetical protein